MFDEVRWRWKNKRRGGRWESKDYLIDRGIIPQVTYGVDGS